MAVPGLGLSVAVARRALEHLPVPWSVVTLPAFGRRARRGTDLAPDQLAEVLLAGLPVASGPVVLATRRAVG